MLFLQRKSFLTVYKLSFLLVLSVDRKFYELQMVYKMTVMKEFVFANENLSCFIEFLLYISSIISFGKNISTYFSLPNKSPGHLSLMGFFFSL